MITLSPTQTEISTDIANTNVELESIGHFFYNLLDYLFNKGIPPFPSIRSTQIFTEKISPLERQQQIRAIPEPLL